MASVEEKQANVENILADSEYKQAQANLDLVKQMIALEDMDLEQIRKSFELAQSIKAANNQLSNAREAI